MAVFVKAFAGLLALLALAGCAEQATPLPVAVPSTLTPEPSTDQISVSEAVRTGILRAILPFWPADPAEDFADYPIIERPISADQLGDLDLLIGLGLHPGWQPSGATLHIALLLNPMLAPLNDPQTAQLLRQSIDANRLSRSYADLPGIMPSDQRASDPSTIRNQLAMAGHPDGFRLVLAAPELPLSENIVADLADYSFAVEQREWLNNSPLESFEANQAHLILVHWYTDEEASSIQSEVGAENTLELFRIPVSYLLRPGLEVQLDGLWPELAD